MLQITPQMKILVAVEPADFRRGIDGLARLCQQALHEDPFAGAVRPLERQHLQVQAAVKNGAAQVCAHEPQTPGAVVDDHHAVGRGRVKRRHGRPAGAGGGTEAAHDDSACPSGKPA